MENFTPYSSLFGGILIGLAATLLLLFNGNIAGIAGILGRSMSSLWRIVFLFGLIFGAFLFQWTFDASYRIAINTPVFVLIVAGILVGFHQTAVELAHRLGNAVPFESRGHEGRRVAD